MNAKDKDKVIGPGKPNKVSKKAHGSVELANRPRKPKEKKSGRGCPKGHRSP